MKPKEKKKMQKDQDITNAGLEADFIDSGGPERVKREKEKADADTSSPEPEQNPEQSPEQELRSKGDKDPKDGGIKDDGVFRDIQLFQFLQKQADVGIMLQHAAGVRIATTTWIRLLTPLQLLIRDMGAEMHARTGPPDKERLVRFMLAFHKV